MSAHPRAADAAARRRAVLAVAADAVSILVFVAIGRRNHDEGTSVANVLGVAAPFLVALGVGWLVLRAWRRPLELTTGLGLWAVTVALGMVLRHVVWDRGTATSFVIVASIVTGALLLGWRAAAGAVIARRLTRSAPPAG